jgi:hypothetical protein
MYVNVSPLALFDCFALPRWFSGMLVDQGLLCQMVLFVTVAVKREHLSAGVPFHDPLTLASLSSIWSLPPRNRRFVPSLPLSLLPLIFQRDSLEVRVVRDGAVVRSCQHRGC